MLKYNTYEITYRELPNEVALSLAVSSCPMRCRGCHSPHLRKDVGTDIWEIRNLMEKYNKHITAVCFLGHGSLKDHKAEFLDVLRYLRTTYPHIKLGLYSGYEYMDEDIKSYLDYYKIGGYREDLGGLGEPNTNQVFHILK